MRLMCASADGVSCVTEHYLQQHYFSKKPQAFSSHYSSLALDKSFYGFPKRYPDHRQFVIAHTSNQVAFNGRKGYNQILEALRILKDKGVSVKIGFAGKDYQDRVCGFLEPFFSRCFPFGSRYVRYAYQSRRVASSDY